MIWEFLGLIDQVRSLNRTGRYFAQILKRESIELDEIVSEAIVARLPRPSIHGRNDSSRWTMHIEIKRYGLVRGSFIDGDLLGALLEVEAKVEDEEERVIWSDSCNVARPDGIAPHLRVDFQNAPALLREAFESAAARCAEEILHQPARGDSGCVACSAVTNSVK